MISTKKNLIAVLVILLTISTLSLPIAKAPRTTFAVTTTTTTTTPATLTGIVVTFMGQTNQVISGTPPFACYNAQVKLNITSYLSTTARVVMPDFMLYEAGQNLQIQNQAYYANANNTISQVTLFPKNPIILIVTFQGLCLLSVTPTSSLHVLLAYDDGINYYQTQVF